MTEALRRELARKAFHLLTLGYLVVYRLYGRALSAALLGLWMAVVFVVENARLRWPPLNVALVRLFGGIIRPAEEARLSGVYYTCLGSWLTIVLFGARPVSVEGGILFLAVGDAAAAVFGRLAGRHLFTLGGAEKSWEGTAACFAACLAIAWGLGVGLPRAAILAAAGALLELAPLPFNDNLWLPLGGAALFRGLA